MNANPILPDKLENKTSKDDVIGFFYALLSALALATSAVFVKLLQGKFFI